MGAGVFCEQPLSMLDFQHALAWSQQMKNLEYDLISLLWFPTVVWLLENVIELLNCLVAWVSL
jgi:hypothetical protein